MAAKHPKKRSDHPTPKVKKKTQSSRKRDPLAQSFLDLVAVVTALRGPQGCPWDKAQTPKTLAPYAIEEAYELVEALEGGDSISIIEELGDVLFQVLLHSEVGRQEKKFTLQAVIETLRSKMVRRHPHVFGSVKLKTPEAVVENWGKIKDQEKKEAKIRNPQQPKITESTLTQNIPRQLPALQRAQKIGSRTRKVGFDWNHPQQVLEKVHEEIGELTLEMNSIFKGKSKPSPSQILNPSAKLKIEHEIGDALFAIAQLARHCELDPEQCLRVANSRFVKRYQHMISLMGESEKEFSQLTSDKKEKLWSLAKKSEKIKSKKPVNR